MKCRSFRGKFPLTGFTPWCTVHRLWTPARCRGLHFGHCTRHPPHESRSRRIMRPFRLLFACILTAVLATSATAAEPFKYPEGKHGKGELKYVEGVPVL